MRNYEHDIRLGQDQPGQIIDVISQRFMMKLLVALIICLCHSTAVFGKTIVSLDFENGNHDKWRVIGNNGVSIISAPSPICSGEFAAEFLLKANEPKARTELVGGFGNLEFGSEYWVGFAIYLSNDWKVDTSRASADTVWNIHGVPDKILGESYRNAPFSLRVKGDSWFFRNAWCATKVCKENKSTALTIGKWKSGRWTEFVLHFKLSYKTDGFIELWKDGESVVKLKGPNTYNDAKAPYMKFGIYKSAWRHSTGAKASGFSSRRLYFDNVVLGDKYETYKSVSPDCGKKSGSLSPPTNLSIK